MHHIHEFSGNGLIVIILFVVFVWALTRKDKDE
jgi:hypothetical protein